MTPWAQLDAAFAREFAPAPRPIAPCPLLPTSDLPPDRSDETRDAHASGA